MVRILYILFVLFLAACEGIVAVDDGGTGLADDLHGGMGAPGAGGTGASGGAQSAQPGPSSLGDQAGEQLYTAYCATCHGAQGAGAPSWPASIAGYAPIAPIVKSGRNGMPALPLADADIQKIQDYLTSLAEPVAQLDGAGLYQRYCSSCHGVDAAGADTWPGSIQGYDPIESIVLNGRDAMDPIPITAEQTAMIQAWLNTLAPPLSSLNGEEVYDRLCVTCHGRQGEGTATKGPQLRYDDDPYSEYWTRTGRTTQDYEGNMPEYPADMVTDAQLGELFAFVNAAAKPTDGRGLYEQYCANCHASNGRGGPSGHSIVGEVSPSEAIVRDGHGGTNYGARRSYMTAWTRAQLTDDEMALIADYVGTL